jgi:hypothetical protein
MLWNHAMTLGGGEHRRSGLSITAVFPTALPQARLIPAPNPL